MFESLGRAVYRGRWSLLALGTVFAVLAGYFGLGLFGRMSDGGFDDPAAESTSAARWSEKWFGGNSPDVVVLYTHPTYEAGDDRFEKDVRATLRALPTAHVANTATYWSTRAKELVSDDKHSTYALITLRGGQMTKQSGYEEVKDQLRRAPDGYTVKIGGRIPLLTDLNEQTGADLQQAEFISMPILLVLLVMVFGSLVAAGLPLVVGLLSVAGALLLLRLLTEVTDVSVFSLNVVTMLGLGLAIDYSLFVLNAFREEIRRGASTEAAVVRTIATAGRTVAFSGLTVATSLSGLLLFPQMFLRSIGLGAAAVVLVAMVSALVVLPALLAVLGSKVDSIKVMPDFGSRKGGTWHAIASSVMRRPVAYLVGVSLLLFALAAPFAHVRFGSVDHRVLPERFESRQVAEEINTKFARNAMSPIEVVVLIERDLVGPMTASVPGALTSEVGTQRGPIGVGNSGITPVTPISPLDVKVFAERLEDLEHVTGVDITGVSQNSGAVRLAVRYDRDPMSDEARALVERIRAMSPEPNFQRFVVGGPTAAQLDLQASLMATLPWTALIVCLMTGLLLFAAFGSVLLPIKAILMNVLSLGASFGVIVWAFQDGHLAEILGFTPTGTIEATITVLILAVVFGLSMDYELFLLSRVRAEWLRTGDNTAAVAIGLERTGGVITSAALLLLVVIAAFSTAGITIVKMLGVGMFVAIVVDATLVRALLVPATMRLMGEANWWLPSFLRGFHRRIEIHEHATDELPATYVTVERAVNRGSHRAVPAHRLLPFPPSPQLPSRPSPPPPVPARPAPQPSAPVAPAVPVRVLRTAPGGAAWQWTEDFPPAPAPASNLEPHVPVPDVRAAGERPDGAGPDMDAGPERSRDSRPETAAPRNGSHVPAPESGAARPGGRHWRPGVSDDPFQQNRSTPYFMPGFDVEPPPAGPASPEPRPTPAPSTASVSEPAPGPVPGPVAESAPVSAAPGAAPPGSPAKGRTKKIIKPNLDGPGWHWAEVTEEPSAPQPLLTAREAMEQPVRHTLTGIPILPASSPPPADPSSPSPESPQPSAGAGPLAFPGPVIRVRLEPMTPEPSSSGVESRPGVHSEAPVAAEPADRGTSPQEPPRPAHLARPGVYSLPPAASGPPPSSSSPSPAPSSEVPESNSEGAEPDATGMPEPRPRTEDTPPAPRLPRISNHLIDQLEPLVQPMVRAIAPTPPARRPAILPTPPPAPAPVSKPDPDPDPDPDPGPVSQVPAGSQAIVPPAPAAGQGGEEARPQERRAQGPERGSRVPPAPAAPPAATPAATPGERREERATRRKAEEPLGGWVAVGTRTTRVVRPTAGGSGWEWAEVDE